MFMPLGQRRRNAEKIAVLVDTEVRVEPDIVLDQELTAQELAVHPGILIFVGDVPECAVLVPQFLQPGGIEDIRSNSLRLLHQGP